MGWTPLSGEIASYLPLFRGALSHADPKVRTFHWRAYHDILPIRVALMPRHIVSNPFCEFCSVAIEIEAHIFFYYSFLSTVWNESPFSVAFYKLPFPIWELDFFG